MLTEVGVERSGRISVGSAAFARSMQDHCNDTTMADIKETHGCNRTKAIQGISPASIA
ncbi:MAG: hypothetical protein JNM13_08965 [Hyphomicrobiaceae bacterium]|nr:hypothetical protein [Hyphomicrobiaceae bacterium]